MRNFMWFLISLLLAGCMRTGNPYRPQQVVALRDEEVVPLRYGGKQFLIDVTVNGLGPYPFLLDTGCTTVVISEDMANALQLKRMRAPGVSTTAYGTVNTCWAVQIPSVALGRTEFKLPTARVAPSAWASGKPYVGIIGFSLLWDRVWTFDGPNRRLILRTKLAAADVTHMSALAMKTKGGVPWVEMSFQRNGKPEGEHLDALIDTGMNTWVPFLISSSSVQVPEQNVQVRVADSSGSHMMSVCPLEEDVNIGGIISTAPIIGVTSFPKGYAIAALPFLQECMITFDRPNGKLWIARPKAASKVSPPASQSTED